MQPVYMDHASATPVRPEVIDTMMPYFAQKFYNPSTVYDLGTGVNEDLEQARNQVGDLIGATPDEIVFTSSGAEANNHALKGAALARRKKGITSLYPILSIIPCLMRLGFWRGWTLK